MGSSAMSKKFVDAKLAEDTAAGCVLYVDVREFMRRKPHRDEQVIHVLDGLHMIAQRAVLPQDGFALCATTTPEAMMRTTSTSSDALIVIMKCTRGGRRAYTPADGLARAANAVVSASKTDRAFSAMHAPLAWMAKWEQLEKAWDSAMELTPHEGGVAPQAGPLLIGKHGHGGVVQRKEAHMTLTDVLDFVDFKREDQAKVKLEDLANVPRYPTSVPHRINTFELIMGSKIETIQMNIERRQSKAENLYGKFAVPPAPSHLQHNETNVVI
jgi:hypothetical protein